MTDAKVSDDFIVVDALLVSRQREWESLLEETEIVDPQDPALQLFDPFFGCDRRALSYKWLTPKQRSLLQRTWLRCAMDGRAIFYPSNADELYLYVFRESPLYRLFVLATLVVMFVAPLFQPAYCLRDRTLSRQKVVWNTFIVMSCVVQFLDIYLVGRTTHIVGLRVANHIVSDASYNWQRLRAVCCSVVLLNALLGMATLPAPGFAGALVPILFIATRHHLKQLAEALVYAFMQITRFPKIWIVFLMTWSFMGYCLLRRYASLPGGDQVHFSTYAQSLYANFHCMLSRPTVLYRLRTIFSQNNYVSFYFVALTVFGDILLTTLVIALGNRAFREFSAKTMNRSLRYRFMAAHALFLLYSEEVASTGEAAPIAPAQDSSASPSAAVERHVPLECWLMFCSEASPRLMTQAVDEQKLLFASELLPSAAGRVGLTEAAFFRLLGSMTMTLRMKFKAHQRISLIESLSQRIKAAKRRVGDSDGRDMGGGSERSPTASIDSVWKQRVVRMMADAALLSDLEAISPDALLGTAVRSLFPRLLAVADSAWWRAVTAASRRWYLSVYPITYYPTNVFRRIKFLTKTSRTSESVPWIDYTQPKVFPVRVFRAFTWTLNLLIVVSTFLLAARKASTAALPLLWLVFFGALGRDIVRVLVRETHFTRLRWDMALNAVFFCLLCALGGDPSSLNQTAETLLMLVQALRCVLLLWRLPFFALFRQIAPVVVRVLITYAMAVYAFAVVGHITFCHVLRSDDLPPTDDDTDGWLPFAAFLNFDSFASSFYTVAVTAVLSNWSMVMDAAATLSSPASLTGWVYVYFYALRISLSLTVIPLLLSSIMQSFIQRLRLQREQVAMKKAAKKGALEAQRQSSLRGGAEASPVALQVADEDAPRDSDVFNVLQALEDDSDDSDDGEEDDDLAVDGRDASVASLRSARLAVDGATAAASGRPSSDGRSERVVSVRSDADSLMSTASAIVSASQRVASERSIQKQMSLQMQLQRLRGTQILCREERLDAVAALWSSTGRSLLERPKRPVYEREEDEVRQRTATAEGHADILLDAMPRLREAVGRGGDAIESAAICFELTHSLLVRHQRRFWQSFAANDAVFNDAASGAGHRFPLIAPDLLARARAALSSPQRVHLACQWLRDAAHGRSLAYPVTEAQLRSLLVHRSSAMTYLLYAVALLQMASVFLIVPYCAGNGGVNLNSRTVDDAVQNSTDEALVNHRALDIFDLLCAVVYIVELALDVHARASLYLRWSWLAQPKLWLALRTCFVLLIVVNALPPLIVHNDSVSDSAHLRLVRALFPVLLIARDEGLSDITRGLVRSARRTVSVYLFFAALLVLFATAGYWLFHRFETHASRFASLADSVLTVLQAATAAPFSLFVIVPYYAISRWTPLFFLALTYASELLCVSLIVGAGTVLFTSYADKTMTRRRLQMHQMVQAAYELLQTAPEGEAATGGDRRRPVRVEDALALCRVFVHQAHWWLPSATLDSSALADAPKFASLQWLVRYVQRHRPLWPSDAPQRLDASAVTREEFFELLMLVFEGADCRLLRRSRPSPNSPSTSPPPLQPTTIASPLHATAVDRPVALRGIQRRLSQLVGATSVASASSDGDDSDSDSDDDSGPSEMRRRRSSLVQRQQIAAQRLAAGAEAADDSGVIGIELRNARRMDPSDDASLQRNRHEASDGHATPTAAPATQETVVEVFIKHQRASLLPLYLPWLLLTAEDGAAPASPPPLWLQRLWLAKEACDRLCFTFLITAKTRVSVLDLASYALHVLLIAQLLMVTTTARHVDVTGWVGLGYALEACFWLEMCVRVVAFGELRYFRDPISLLRGVLNVASLVTMCLVSRADYNFDEAAGVSSVFVTLVALQCLRVTLVFLRLRGNGRYASAIAATMRALFLLALALFFFTIFAQDRFCSVLRDDNVAGDAQSNDDAASSWNQFSDILVCSNYAQTLFTLFEVTVLGSWSMVMDAAASIAAADPSAPATVSTPPPPLLRRLSLTRWLRSVAGGVGVGVSASGTDDATAATTNVALQAVTPASAYVFFFTFRLFMTLLVLPLLVSYMVRSYVALLDQVAFIRAARRQRRYLPLAVAPPTGGGATTAAAAATVDVVSTAPAPSPLRQLAKRLYRAWTRQRLFRYVPIAAETWRYELGFLDVWDVHALRQTDVVRLYARHEDYALRVAENLRLEALALYAQVGTGERPLVAMPSKLATLFASGGSGATAAGRWDHVVSLLRESDQVPPSLRPSVAAAD